MAETDEYVHEIYLCKIFRKQNVVPLPRRRGKDHAPRRHGQGRVGGAWIGIPGPEEYLPAVGPSNMDEDRNMRSVLELIEEEVRTSLGRGVLTDNKQRDISVATDRDSIRFGGPAGV